MSSYKHTPHLQRREGNVLYILWNFAGYVIIRVEDCPGEVYQFNREQGHLFMGIKGRIIPH